MHWARNGIPIVFDVQRAMLNCRVGTLKRTGCSFARMIIGPNLASRVNNVDRLVTYLRKKKKNPKNNFVSDNNWARDGGWRT